MKLNITIKYYNNYRFITAKSDKLELILTDLGASIFKLSYNHECLSLYPTNIDDYFKKDLYYGKTIGPFVNRIKGGILKFENKTYQYELNDTNNSLHGANKAYSNTKFDFEYYFINDYLVITFYKEFEDAKVKIIYEVHEDYFEIKFAGLAKEDTILNMTNHLFFTMNTPFNNMLLEFKSNYYLENDKELIALGYKDNNDFINFNEPKKLTKDIDHAFDLEKGEIHLYGDDLTIKMTTDFKYVQIYTDNFIDEVVTNIRRHNKRAIAIEPEDDIFIRKELKQGQSYNRYIKYEFVEKEKEEN